ncbi:MAG: AAA family ATPase [Clostridiaceae bacterium]|nr:AAA family ATPase [Clostridiaceae bacterium]
MIVGLTLRNFALFTELRFGLVEPESPSLSEARLNPLTAIIGRNNSGKSTILESLDFLADCLRVGVRAAATRNHRGGFSKLRHEGSTEPVSLEIVLNLPEHNLVRYTLEISADRQGRPFVNRERLEKLGTDGISEVYLDLKEGQGKVRGKNSPSATGVNDLIYPALSLYGRLSDVPSCFRDTLYLLTRIFFFRLDSKSSAQKDLDREGSAAHLDLAQGRGGHKHLNSNGTNVRNVLVWLREEEPLKYERIMNLIDQRLPLSPRLRRDLQSGLYNSGEARFFILQLLLLDPDPRPVILLDNPDSGMFYTLQSALGLALREYELTRRGQVILSTHNTNLLDTFAPSEVWYLPGPPQIEGRTEPGPSTTWDLLSEYSEIDPGASEGVTYDSEVRADCAADDPIIRAMYDEGMSMGILWYQGYFT